MSTLSLDQALQALKDGGDTVPAVYAHLRRSIAELKSAALRSDNVGINARHALDRLRQELER